MTNHATTSQPSDWPLLALVLAWMVGNSSLLTPLEGSSGGSIASAVFILGAGGSIGLHELVRGILLRRAAAAGSCAWRSELGAGALGLATNLIVAIAALASARLVYLASGPDVVVRALAAVASLNIVLTATNLLPVLPMDGGRILSAIVSRASGRPALAMRLIAVLTEITGWLLLVSGLAAALTNGLTVGIVWLLIGVLVLREGRSERRKLSEYGAGPQHPPRHYQAHGWRGVATTIETHQSGLPGPGR